MKLLVSSNKILVKGTYSRPTIVHVIFLTNSKSNEIDDEMIVISSTF